ncbi:hypothetical protein CSM73_004237 [Salmonella enterica subsp. diarizonae]|nr:hypothetical protein [Salmonella enterica subsp. diarizonae]EED9398060.1 hypothetical protein [Salmonella enterica subsp. enterica serovar Oranienburg]
MPPLIFCPAKNRKIFGVFVFLAPGRHLIRTSFLPPYGVTDHEFVKTISNLAPKNKTLKKVSPSAYFSSPCFSLN